MRTAIPISRWSSVKRWLPGVIISAVAFWLVLRNISFQNFSNALSSINLPVLILVVAIYFFSLGFRALCWQVLLQKKAPFSLLLLVLGEGYLLNNLLPLRVGELGRAVLLGRRKDMGFFKVLSTIVVERAYDMVIAAGLMLGTIPLVLNMDSSKPLAIGILSVVILGLVVLVWMAHYREKVKTLAMRIGGRWSFVANWVIPKLDSLLEGFAVLNRPQYFAISFGFMLLCWGSSILEEYVILRSLIPTAPFWWVGFVIAAAALGAAVPSAPAALGVYEGFTVAALSLVGVDPATGLVFAILAHFVSFTFSNLVGVIGLVKEGESISSLYQSLVVRKKATTSQ